MDPGALSAALVVIVLLDQRGLIERPGKSIHPHLINGRVGVGGRAEQAELRDVKVLQGLRPGSPQPWVYDAVPIAAPQPPPPTSSPPTN